MSIKIYNAWETTEPMHVVMGALFWLRERVRQRMEKHLDKVMNERTERRDAFAIAQSYAADVKEDRDGFICGAALYACTLLGADIKVVHLFGIKDSLTRDFAAQLEARDMHYQTQEERPAHISQYEWARRAEVLRWLELRQVMSSSPNAKTQTPT